MSKPTGETDQVRPQSAVHHHCAANHGRDLGSGRASDDELRGTAAGRELLWPACQLPVLLLNGFRLYSAPNKPHGWRVPHRAAQWSSQHRVPCRTRCPLIRLHSTPSSPAATCVAMQKIELTSTAWGLRRVHTGHAYQPPAL